MANNHEQPVIDKFKNDFIAGLDWDFKRKPGNSEGAQNIDVIIKHSKSSQVKNGLIIVTFKNGSYKKIDPENSNRIVSSIWDNKIYFMAHSKGFLLTVNNNSKGSRYLRMQYQEKYKPFEGEYILKYDTLNGLYYIEKGVK